MPLTRSMTRAMAAAAEEGDDAAFPMPATKKPEKPDQKLQQYRVPSKQELFTSSTESEGSVCGGDHTYVKLTYTGRPPRGLGGPTSSRCTRSLKRKCKVVEDEEEEDGVEFSRRQRGESVATHRYPKRSFTEEDLFADEDMALSTVSQKQGPPSNAMRTPHKRPPVGLTQHIHSRPAAGAVNLRGIDLSAGKEATKEKLVAPGAAHIGFEQFAEHHFNLKHEHEQEFLPQNFLGAIQPKVSIADRASVVHWLTELNEQYRYNPETLHLAVNLLDRFFKVQPLASDCIQLAAITCYFIATKQEEVYFPVISELLTFCTMPYKASQMRSIEAIILRKVDYRLTPHTSHTFLELYASKAATGCPLSEAAQQLARKGKIVARFILQLSLQDYDTVQWPASLLAASALTLGISCVSNLGGHPFVLSKFFKSDVPDCDAHVPGLGPAEEYMRHLAHIFPQPDHLVHKTYRKLRQLTAPYLGGIRSIVNTYTFPEDEAFECADVVRSSPRARE